MCENDSGIETTADTLPLRVEREGWLSIAGGGVIMVIVLMIPVVDYIFNYLIILVHEFGHCFFGWLFGYPSLPVFDAKYGGGLTVHQGREMCLVIIIYALCGCLLFFYRRNLLTVISLAVILAAYSLAAFTRIHEVIILFMGHGFELVFAGIFLYRALSGSAIIQAAERPLYGCLGLFIEFRDIRFGFNLVTSRHHREAYEAAKGGGHWMDFSRIAENYLHVDLTVVAGFFLLCCFIPPVLAFIAYRYRPWWLPAMYERLSLKPGADE